MTDSVEDLTDENPRLHGGFVDVGAAEEFADGQMAGFDIDGERVLLAKVAGEFYAIGGVCTHERAFLDQGALYENVVFCPLHFSSFDVRSGAVLGPPADRDTPTYAVRLDNGRVLISTGAPAGSDAAETQHVAEVHTEPTERALPWHSRLSEWIDSLGWLRRLSEALCARLTRLRGRLTRTRLLDLLHGRWFGHALHPALSDLPIGLWASSLFLYVIGLSQPAAILSVAGMVAAIATALTGIADYSVAEGQERRSGLLHGILMTVALVIQAGSAAVYYFAGWTGLALALSAAGFVMTTLGAHLGGHLVFAHGTMVNHASWPQGSVRWVRTIEESELDAAAGRTKAVDAGATKVLLHRNRDGRISAITNACSHAGAALSLGEICGDTATCPWHDSKFRMSDGAVTSGPAIYPQPVFQVRVQDGWIEVRSGA